ncbi:MAG TPA: four helix bundle protein [Flavisolibacter sp.]|jgi:four helix bundle protein|nr:four helix bundle protein [Flavisolibacter sp.]
MHKELFNNNPILRHSFDFALAVVEYCDVLQSEKHFVISNQLLKSGTSIGANIMEAQNAESKADFIHKMKIAAKEAGETQYWLMLCDAASTYTDCSHLIKKLDEINKILSKILSTAKRKSPLSS